MPLMVSTKGLSGPMADKQEPTSDENASHDPEHTGIALPVLGSHGGYS